MAFKGGKEIAQVINFYVVNWVKGSKTIKPQTLVDKMAMQLKLKKKNNRIGMVGGRGKKTRKLNDKC